MVMLIQIKHACASCLHHLLLSKGLAKVKPKGEKRGGKKELKIPEQH